MATTTVLGDGPLGQAIELALRARDETVRVLGRPPGGRHDPTTLGSANLIVDASRADVVATNFRTALASIESAALGSGSYRDRSGSTALMYVRQMNSSAASAKRMSSLCPACGATSYSKKRILISQAMLRGVMYSNRPWM